jgi:hypothetical protein
MDSIVASPAAGHFACRAVNRKAGAIFRIALNLDKIGTVLRQARQWALIYTR